MEIDFSLWRTPQNDIEKILDQHSSMVDIPPNSDLAEYFKTAKSNIIHRARQNTGIKNTCIPNTEYSFYMREGTFIAGYDLRGHKYLCNFTNLIFGQWQKVDFYNRETIVQNYDANELLDSGSYAVAAHSKNFPLTLPNGGISTEGIIEVANWNNQYVMQTFTSMWNGKKYIRSNANTDGAQWRSWVETAVTESAGEITLLNGWELYPNESLTVTKIGDYVAINFVIIGGDKTTGTPIFVLPVGFRPSTVRTLTILAYGHTAATARIVAYPNGNVLLYNAETIERYIVCSAGFSVA